MHFGVDHGMAFSKVQFVIRQLDQADDTAVQSDTRVETRDQHDSGLAGPDTPLKLGGLQF